MFLGWKQILLQKIKPRKSDVMTVISLLWRHDGHLITVTSPLMVATTPLSETFNAVKRFSSLKKPVFYALSFCLETNLQLLQLPNTIVIKHMFGFLIVLVLFRHFLSALRPPDTTAWYITNTHSLSVTRV